MLRHGVSRDENEGRLLRELTNPSHACEFARDGAPPLDLVITVCDNAAGEVCPVWPGQPMTAHWGVPDPASVEGSDEDKRRAISETSRVLLNRMRIFVSLPLDKLDRLSLQNKLRDIGKAGA